MEFSATKTAARTVDGARAGEFYQFCYRLSICSPERYRWSPGRLTAR